MRLAIRLATAFFLSISVPTVALAQARALHWDDLQVTAHLDANGFMQVVETQSMVFTGDWNGGERKFNIRPRQRLIFTGLFRESGTGWQPMTENADLSRINDFAWTDSQTLRWRSRRPGDPPFNNTAIRYQIRYDLSGILQKTDDGYLLDHDFAFPDRVGSINRFELHLTVDPVWHPAQPLQETYAATNLPPGRSFVLTVPLTFSGTGTPAILDLSRPREIQLAVLTVLGATILIVVWFFTQEHARGRFASLQQEDQIDERWLREHILKYPAEVVGAAWDDRVGQPEVVALLARLAGEDKLTSEASSAGNEMTLHLTKPRSSFDGYERALIDGLFFNDKTTTSTSEVRQHYKTQGFDPAAAIRKDLETTVRAAFPSIDPPRRVRVETLLIFVFGLGALVGVWFRGYFSGPATYGIGIASCVLAGLSTLPGNVFRSRMDWGHLAAALCLIPAAFVAGAMAVFLWFYAGVGVVELPTVAVLSLVALAVGIINASVNALRSREGSAGIAARKQLTAARAFFVAQLRQRQPAMRDDWYPWVLAFGLSKQMDDWSLGAENASAAASTISTSSPSHSSHSGSGWSGFGGGQSGGAGASATWAAAATGLAAGVASASSSSSGGGGGGGSSGGGGGGGW